MRMPGAVEFLLAGILLAGVAGAGIGSVRAAPGKINPRMMSMLKGGTPRAQAIAARKELSGDPENPRLQLNLAVSLAKVGKCTESLDLLWNNIDALEFTAKEALIAAQCSNRVGLNEDALMFDRMGLSEEPDSVRGWTQLALHADKVGDTVAVAEALEALEAQSRGGDPAIYARTALAIRRGDLDEFAICRSLWVRAGWQERDVVPMEAQVWLDLDDPETALSLTTAISMTRMPSRYAFAEAYRRLGQASDAAYVLDNARLRPSVGVNSDAILIRVRSDQGDRAAAAALLADYTDSSEPDILASRWYVARLDGDPAEMARWSAAWEEVRDNPLQRLEQLIPIPER